MADFLVTHVSREPGSETIVGITHLAGPGWLKSRQEVVELLESGQDTFYTVRNGLRRDVAIVRGALGDYLSTKVGGLWTSDLLSLPVLTPATPDAGARHDTG
ncbi:MAG TPA: DUF3892 domain-containing protein [Chloroflexota bacterium]|nr:DUF3892 domain-containing protein [Chloroflexota bacterium]